MQSEEPAVSIALFTSALFSFVFTTSFFSCCSPSMKRNKMWIIADSSSSREKGTFAFIHENFSHFMQTLFVLVLYIYMRTHWCIFLHRIKFLNVKSRFVMHSFLPPPLLLAPEWVRERKIGFAWISHCARINVNTRAVRVCVQWECWWSCWDI